MFLSILPDIDIIFRLAGMDLGHRTVTHSAIISLVVGGILISYFTLRYRKGSEAAVYLIAFLSHLLIGDILVGPINVLYPVGEFVIDIEVKGVQSFLLETIMFALMASIVITKYYKFKKQSEDNFLFSYHRKIDTLLYPILILALTASFLYVLAKFELDLFEISIVAPLHSAAICLVVLMWRVSKGKKPQRELVPNL